MMTSKEVRIADYLQQDCILCHVDAESRDKAIDLLVETLCSKIDGVDRGAAVQAVVERERQAPTVLAEGLALPHARLDGLVKPMLALATSHEGIDFEAVGEEPVHVVVLILTPKDDPGAYLRLMASLSKMLAAPHMITRLAAAGTAREVFGILTEGAEEVVVLLNASSVMNCNPITLDEGDTLASAIHAFCANRVLDIPIVDSDGDLRGVIAIEDLLDQSLPRHLLWMEDLSPIENFEPFSELLRKDSETKVADFMHDKFVAIGPSVPAIQLAKMFLMQHIRQIQVVEGRRFLGVVNLDSFSSQIFWA
ncbi:PTS sugar transporter subunit IIA [Pontiella sulfatireligans]|uniref:PTS system fructose-specific EIIABC component n=1 Tax=Pontiella sulfatireligans TaxID=2750658 RepID=A0A6C2UGW7_9BACT|nr:PTS sugar transporter subunit IIA [Pontiella sulfatireligans]VGO19452.1 PTS system fructose-specific EIIABC component [Pontiella sulfatireligans]